MARLGPRTSRRSCCPMPARLASLLDCEPDDVERRPARLRPRAARTHYGAVVLVKGVESHIVAPDGACWKYRGGAAGPRRFGQRRRARRDRRRTAGARRRTAHRFAVGGVAPRRSRCARLSKSVGAVGFLAREIPGRNPGVCSAADKPELAPGLGASRARRRSAGRRGARWSSPPSPNGIPAMMMTRSPPWAMPWRSAMRLAFSTISSKLETSRVWTA